MRSTRPDVDANRWRRTGPELMLWRGRLCVAVRDDERRTSSPALSRLRGVSDNRWP